MPPIDITDAFREVAASNPDNVTETETVTLDHSTFPAPFRLALADKDITLDGDLYTGIQFSSVLPPVQAKASGGMKITITDIDFDLGSLLDAAVQVFEPISVLWKTFLSTEVSAQAEFSTALDATSISISGRTLSFSATYPDIINKKVPLENYTLNDFPGLR